MDREIALQDRLFKFANDYRRDAEAAGRGTQHPTIRECAEKLRVSQARIHDMAENLRDDEKPLDIYVGAGINGCGARSFESVGDYEIATWDEESPPAPVRPPLAMTA